jgi:hypothetical protein
MLPGEEIPTEGGHRLRAFLVEMRSRGGHSGSPVFLIWDEFKAPPLRSLEEIEDAERWGRRRYPRPPTLLGIDQGQFPTFLDLVTEDGKPLWLPDKRGIERKVWVKERSALTIIIPSWRIVELLRDERLSEMRRSKKSEDEKPAKAVEESEEPDKALTKEDFESSLRKATQPIENEHDTRRR